MLLPQVAASSRATLSADRPTTNNQQPTTNNQQQPPTQVAASARATLSADRPLVALHEPADIYLMLLDAVVNEEAALSSAKGADASEAGGPGGGGSGGGGGEKKASLWTDAAWLLSRKRTRLDATAVARRLPPDVPLPLLMPLLGGLLRHGLEARRNLEVVRQLRRADGLAVREEQVGGAS
jgi:hypothetical protein